MGVCDDGEEAEGAADRAAGAVGGGDIMGLQLAGCCKHAVGVCEIWEEGGGIGTTLGDGAAGAAGGCNVRPFMATQSFYRGIRVEHAAIDSTLYNSTY